MPAWPRRRVPRYGARRGTRTTRRSAHQSLVKRGRLGCPLQLQPRYGVTCTSASSATHPYFAPLLALSSSPIQQFANAGALEALSVLLRAPLTLNQAHLVAAACDAVQALTANSEDNRSDEGEIGRREERARAGAGAVREQDGR